MRRGSLEKRTIIYSKQAWGRIFFPNVFDIPFKDMLFLLKELGKKHMFEKKNITTNTLLTEMKSRPREYACKEGFIQFLLML